MMNLSVLSKWSFLFFLLFSSQLYSHSNSSNHSCGSSCSHVPNHVVLTASNHTTSGNSAQNNHTQQVIRCATDEVHQDLLQSYPDFAQNLAEIEQFTQNFTAKESIDTTSTRQIITIPVVFHILYSNAQQNISDAQIISQIDALNEDFRRLNADTTNTPGPFAAISADTEIEFCLAVRDPQGNPTDGIVRVQTSVNTFGANNAIKYTAQGGSDAWPRDSYMNFWVGNLSGGLLGYAQFPGGPAATDGIVVNYTNVGRPPHNPFQNAYNLGRTGTHEVGHWLNLRHIWGDANCGNDFVNDTPTQQGSNSGCPNFPWRPNSCGQTNPNGDMYMNYMDYTVDACMNAFSQGQKSRMLAALNGPRSSLLNSLGCTPLNAPPQTDFTADNVNICPGGTVQFTDISNNVPSTWDWSFPGGTPSTSSDPNPSVTYQNAGTYQVSLTTTNAFGTDTEVKSAFINVGPFGNEIIFSEDFESGSFTTNGWTIDNPDGGITWEIVTVGGNTPGNNAARVNLFSYPDVGERDGLISPVLDFSQNDSIKLTFEHAHRRFSADFSDTLRVYVSTDGGSTWPDLIFEENETGAGNFATGTFDNTNFVPSTQDDWCFSGTVGVSSCFELDLGDYVGETNVRIKFETGNNYGNNIYIDNIEISGRCVPQNVPPVPNFVASPQSGCEPLTVEFTDLSQLNPTSWSWTFPGGNPSTSNDPNPVVVYDQAGNYDVTLEVTNSNGSSTEVKTSYISVLGSGQSVTLPFSEDFESNSFATNGWTVENPNGGLTWEIVTVGGSTPGDKAARVNHYDYLDIGARDYLISPPLDFSNYDSVFMTFEHAHRRFSQDFADSLIVSVSIDCGLNFPFRLLAVAEDGTGAFATGTTINNNFLPSQASDWCFSGTVGADCFDLDLSQFAGESTVFVRFETYNDYGNNIYIDNINIDGISIPPTTPPSADFTPSSNLECAGSTIQFTDNSTGDALTYDWSFPGGSPSSSTQQNPSVIYNTPGVYDVSLTVSNSAGSDVSSVNGLIEITPSPIVNSSVDGISCNGENDGSIVIQATGGTGLTYQWSDGSSGTTLTDLNAGNYTVTVTNNEGCETVESINIVQPQVLNVSGIVGLSDCSASSGTIQLSVSGGTSPYSFNWSNGANSQNLTGLSSGPYSVTVTDANGCENIRNYFVSSVQGPQLTQSSQNVSCNGAADGQIDVSTSGGTAPFTFDWSSGQSTSSISNLSPGTYTVTVTDAQGCETLGSVVINEPPALVIDLQVSDDPCGNGEGSAEVSVSGGSPSYSIQWSNGLTGTEISGLTSGNYEVNVTDNNGCSETIPFEVETGEQLQLLTYTTPDSGNAEGVAIVEPLNGQAPFTILWDDPNNQDNDTAVNLTAGIYQVIVEDANGCIGITEAQVDFYLPVSANELESNDVFINVYPNPAFDQLNIFIENEKNETTILSIYSLKGQLLDEIDFGKSHLIEKSIDLRSFAAGVYFVKVKTESHQKNFRIIKK
ncbi:MAG: PKD domain-containing protein [Chitinophagaceae bacterium]|nr:MAG: PKD domain-containing protein [Chitinophagaceae bacterium]